MKYKYVLSGLLFSLANVLGGMPADSEDKKLFIEESIKKNLPWVEEYAREAMNQTGVPGLSLIVVYKGEAVLIDGFGTRKAGEDLPVDPYTVFQLASLSKPMTSSVVAAAVDRELLQWGDPVAKYNVGLSLSQPWLTNNVTVADLLSHRSGLPDFAGDYLEELGFAQDVILQRVGLLDQAYPFRDGYAYTNFGFTAGALAASNAAGKDWASLAQELIFEPLGMTATSYRYTDYEQSANRAYIHFLTEEEGADARFKRNADTQAPAGGLSTNAMDYARWMIMQLQGGSYDERTIITKESLEEGWRPHSQNSYNPTTFKAGYYGLGWNVGHSELLGLKLSHSGAFYVGARTGVTLFPESDLGIAVFTNAGSNGVPEAVMTGFIDMVERGELQRDWISFGNEQFRAIIEELEQHQIDLSQRPSDPVFPREFSAYEGTYANNYFGVLKVELNGDDLFLTIGPKPMRFLMEHWNGDTFVFFPSEEMSSAPGEVVFEISIDEEKASSITIPYFDEGDFQKFLRVPDSTSAQSSMDTQGLMEDFLDIYSAISYLQIMPPAMIVVAVSGDSAVIRTYGETSVGSGVEPDENTVFGIGSISKVFTGNLLASMVVDGFVEFTSPLSQYLPGREILPGITKNGRELRLIDLATQTSGFPREILSDLNPQERTIDRYIEWLGTSTLFFPPGTSVLYSNMGFDLLGHSLGVAAGSDYASALNRFVTTPLGLQSTGPYGSIGKDRAWLTSYGLGDSAIELSPTSDLLVASGGLFTTAEDVRKWMQWNLGAAQDLTDKRLLSQSLYVPRDNLNNVSGVDLANRMDAMSLGWVATFLDDDRLIINKTGARDGYMSYVVLEPAKRRGIFVVINKFDFAGYQMLVQNMNSLLSQIPGSPSN